MKTKIIEHLCDHCKNKNECIYANNNGNIYSCPFFIEDETIKKESPPKKREIR